MEHRIPTIFEVAEAAARRQKKSEPEAGQRKLKAARKPAARMSGLRPSPSSLRLDPASCRAQASPKRKPQAKRKRR